jgi:uncharacterized protein (DUF362 family)
MSAGHTARSISRREFLKLAAAGTVGVLTGCSPASPPSPTAVSPPTDLPVPTDKPAPTSAPAATETPEPTATPEPAVDVGRPDTIKTYLNALGKVIRTHHSGVWDGAELVPAALREMLDGSVTALMGLDDATAAWAALFDPGERIAIKVNAIRGGFTHVPLVMAVVERLQEMGVPPEQITIFDRNTAELEDAGYTVNQDGPGVRCYGNGDDWGDVSGYTAGWTLLDDEIKLSDILLDCDALINIPILKVARGAGISFAMKNHYGTFDIPWRFHEPKFDLGIPELNALPPIKDRTRLIVGDVLTPDAYRGSLDGYRVVGIGNTMLVSFDPVAHDAVGLQIAEEDLAAVGLNAKATVAQASRWLQNGTEMGLGTDNADDIDVVGVNLK